MSSERFGTVPGTSIALLSVPSKMPGYSWSLPAHLSCPRQNGNICGDCYAGKGFYRMPAVERAQRARFEWTRDMMKSEVGMTVWADTMIEAIRKTRGEWFRVHDSGDMFNAKYAMCWHAVCKRLPEVRFWIPTRAWQLPGGLLTVHDPLMHWLRELNKLGNVSVRPSALNFGDPAPAVEGLDAGTTATAAIAGYRAVKGKARAVKGTKMCPAHEQGNRCGECRVCWTERGTAMSYGRH